jgi:hypothetical protein
MAKDKSQNSLFDVNELNKWQEEWQGMPEFIQEDKQPIQTIVVSFETKEDVQDFANLIGQKLTYKTKSIWFPQKSRDIVNNKIYVDEP